jgi:hypothetical protein
LLICATLRLLGYLSINLYEIIVDVVNLKIYSLFILHYVQAGKAALYSPPKPFTTHEAAEHRRKAECNNYLVDEEHQQEDLVKSATALHCREAYRNAKYEDRKSKQIRQN